MAQEEAGGALSQEGDDAAQGPSRARGLAWCLGGPRVGRTPHYWEERRGMMGRSIEGRGRRRGRRFGIDTCSSDWCVEGLTDPLLDRCILETAHAQALLLAAEAPKSQPVRQSRNDNSPRGISKQLLISSYRQQCSNAHTRRPRSCSLDSIRFDSIRFSCQRRRRCVSLEELGVSGCLYWSVEGRWWADGGGWGVGRRWD